jgi:hypothetical protein
MPEQGPNGKASTSAIAGDRFCWRAKAVVAGQVCACLACETSPLAAMQEKYIDEMAGG